MKTLTLVKLKRFVAERFGGKLMAGKHSEDGEACALECLSAWQGISWTDDPAKTRTFDLRPINDIHVPDALRAKHLLPVLVAYAGSLDWPQKRQRAVAEKIVIGTVNKIVAELPGLPAEIAEQCRRAATIQAAAVAVAGGGAAGGGGAEPVAATVAEGAGWESWEAAWDAAAEAEEAEEAEEAQKSVFVAACG